MNILCSINERFIRQYKCLMYSLASTQSDDIELYFLNSSLTTHQIKNIKTYTTKLGIGFHLLEVPEDLTRQLVEARSEALNGILNRTFSVECFYRVFAHLLLPSTMTRILWLDVDCIVQRDLYQFYNYNLFDNIGFATLDAYELDFGQHEYVQTVIKEPLGLAESDPLFNSGVLLMNLTALRNDSCFTKEFLLKYIQENPQIHFDQDILNALGKNKVIVNQDLTFNYPPNWSCFEELQDSLPKKHILHYYGIYKPWLGDTNTAVIGVTPWRQVDHMTKIFDKAIGTDKI